MQYRSHRGGVYYTPENTMAAFRKAMTEDFVSVETDPRLTKDGVIVLHHDDTINRTCRNADGSALDHPVMVDELTYDELMTYDAGLYLGEEFRGEKVPRLDELLTLAEGSDVIIALDKKMDTEHIEPLLDVVEKHSARVSFSCQDVERIEAVLARFPDAMIDYDGPALEEPLGEVLSRVPYDRLLVWMFLDKPNFAWLEDTRKTSAAKCAVVKKHARLGIANVNNPYDVREALEFGPDVLEV